MLKDCDQEEHLSEKYFTCNAKVHDSKECKSERLLCPACKMECHKGGGKCPSLNRALAIKRGPEAAKGKAGKEMKQYTYTIQYNEGRMMLPPEVFGKRLYSGGPASESWRGTAAHDLQKICLQWQLLVRQQYVRADVYQ